MVKAFFSQDRENYMWQHMNTIACSGYFPNETCSLLHKNESACKAAVKTTPLALNAFTCTMNFLKR